MGLSADTSPVRDTRDKSPASMPAAIIGSSNGVMDSDTRSRAALNGFFLPPVRESGAWPLIPSMETSSSCTSETWVPMMIWYATSLETTSMIPSMALISSVCALLLSFSVNRSLVMQCTTALMLSLPPTRRMIFSFNV